MKNKQFNYKELKKPDNFQQYALKLLDFIIQFKGPLILGFLSLFLVFGGFFTFEVYKNQQAENRKEKLASIKNIFESENTVVKNSQSLYKKQIEKTKKTLEATTEAKAKLKVEKNLKEAEKKLKDLKADHSKSMLKLTAFIKEHQDTLESWHASLFGAQTLVVENKFQEAVKLLEQSFNLKKLKVDKFYWQQMTLYYLSLLEQTSQYEKALTVVNPLLKSKNNDLGVKAHLIKARLLWALKKNTESKQTLQQLINQYPNNKESNEAQALLMIFNENKN